MNNKNRFIILAIGIVVLIGLGLTLYYFQPVEQPSPIPTDQIAPVQAPEYASPPPLENKPDLNPVDQTNPFKGVKTNPFE